MKHPILEMLDRIKEDAEAISLDLADIIVLATERPRGDEDKVSSTKVAYYNDQGSYQAKRHLSSIERALVREASAMRRIRDEAQAIFSGEPRDETLRGSWIHPDELAELVRRRDERWAAQRSTVDGSDLEQAAAPYEPHRLEDQPAHPANKNR